jgi:hypothetical protein
MGRRYAQHEDRQAPPVTAAEARARAERFAAGEGPGREAIERNGAPGERGYLVEPDHPMSTLRRPLPRRGRLIVVLAVAALIATAVVVTTRSGASDQRHNMPTAPPTTTTTPLTASRVARMLATGQFAAIANEIEPPSRRSADQVILEQAWADLTNQYGTVLSTETQDEDLFAPPAPPDSPGAVVDETVLQMSHGLILLRVTLSPHGALVHVELQAHPPQWPDSMQAFPGRPSGF